MNSKLCWHFFDKSPLPARSPRTPRRPPSRPSRATTASSSPRACGRGASTHSQVEDKSEIRSTWTLQSTRGRDPRDQSPSNRELGPRIMPIHSRCRIIHFITNKRWKLQSTIFRNSSNRRNKEKWKRILMNFRKIWKFHKLKLLQPKIKDQRESTSMVWPFKEDPTAFRQLQMQVLPTRSVWELKKPWQHLNFQL